MRVGPVIRKLMPASIERTAARMYRSIFVDLRKVAGVLSQALPENALVLDIGGGDGDLLNHLLRLRPDVRVAMVDIAGSVGKFLEPGCSGKVELHPGISIEDHVLKHAGRYDAAMISDVMHHIPEPHRAGFLYAVSEALRPGGRIFVKDVEPGHPISRLGLYCDRYLSGDRNVELISAERLCELSAVSLPNHSAREIGLFELDRPNYLVQLHFA